jgi:phospholipase/lecithinase/hemolysin
MRSLAFVAAITALILTGPVSAGPIPIVVVGDSLSDPYSNYTGANNPSTGLPYWGSAGDKNWVEQFQGHYLTNVNIYNYALAGATTADLLGSPSDMAAQTVQTLPSARGVVIAGANDVLAFLNGQLGNNQAAFISGVATNLNGILTKLETAGPMQWVIGNVPDPAVTPTMQALLGGTPGALQNLSTLVQAVNQQIASVAAAHGAAIVDLYGLSHLFDNPVALGGNPVPSDKLFAPDGFHPASIPQGLISNSIMTAFGGDLSDLLLSDQALLKQVGLSPSADANPKFFDVSPFVQHNVAAAAPTPEPASLVLLSLACCSIAARRYRRR